MSDAFTLDRRKLERMFEETLEQLRREIEPQYLTEPALDLEMFLVSQLDDPRLHDVPSSEELAWLLYLVGVSQCWTGPRGFGGKSVLGHSVRGPIADDALLIQVNAVEIGNAPVCTEPLDADQLLGERPRSTAESFRQIADAVEAMLDEASKLIPRALEAAERAGP